MAEALSQVKRKLGPDAVILGTRTVREGGLGGLVGPVIEITAAPACALNTNPRTKPNNTNTRPPAPPQADRAAPPNTETQPYTDPQRHANPPRHTHLDHLRTQLATAEVGDELAQRLLRELAQRVPHCRDAADPKLQAALQNILVELMPTAGGIILAESSPTRVAVIGPAGAGKSTAIAKLAAQFKGRHNRSVAILTLDMQRFGAHEQMRRYAELIGVQLFTAQTVAAVKEVLQKTRQTELLLIDTHGLGHRDHAHFARLAALVRAAKPDETHLVLPAYMSVNAQARTAEFFRPLAPTHVLLTHLDELLGFGVVLNALDRLHLKLSYLSDGQRVPQDLKEACSNTLAGLVLQPCH